MQNKIQYFESDPLRKCSLLSSCKAGIHPFTSWQSPVAAFPELVVSASHVLQNI